MVSDLDIPVETVMCPTIREDNGLAISSRNVQLEQSQRQSASVIYRALSATRDRYRAGNHNYQELVEGCRRIITNEQSIHEIEYIEIVDLWKFTKWNGEGPCLLVIAVKIDEIRLIDNVIMD